MPNEIWRLDSEFLAAFTTDKAIMRKVQRSYPQFNIYAEYFKEGERIAVIYRVPSAKKKTIKRMLGVNMTGDRISA